jgi:uncharacterized oxidoreductase
VLVNNAGIQNWMTISDDDFYEKATAEITTNIVAPLHLTSLFIKLKSLNTIINVTSGLAFVQLSKVPFTVQLRRFSFIYTFNETLAKEKTLK